VLLPDGTNVIHTLVKEGWCWRYRKYATGDTVLEGLEKEAQEAKKGLWADPQPRSRRGSGGRGQNGPTNENCKSNQRGSKGSTIAVAVGCAIAVATAAVLPSIELSITDSRQIAGPIKAEVRRSGHRYWVTQLQFLADEVRYLEVQPERLTVEVEHQKSSPIVSDHKSMPIGVRWFPALGIRHKSRDSSYTSCFT
jgi:hypothetical protein